MVSSRRCLWFVTRKGHPHWRGEENHLLPSEFVLYTSIWRVPTQYIHIYVRTIINPATSPRRKKKFPKSNDSPRVRQTGDRIIVRPNDSFSLRARFNSTIDDSACTYTRTCTYTPICYTHRGTSIVSTQYNTLYYYNGIYSSRFTTGPMKSIRR